MPSWWQNLQSKLASYYREYEFVTAIYVLEPWEKRWANGKKKMKDKNHFVRKSKLEQKSLTMMSRSSKTDSPHSTILA